MSKHARHPANVSGDFYVEDNCCTMCGVPFDAAPELFGEFEHPEGGIECYVKRQPANPTEVDHMIEAISRADLRCIRYEGRDRETQQRLVKINEAAQCDNLPPPRSWWRRALGLVSARRA